MAKIVSYMMTDAVLVNNEDKDDEVKLKEARKASMYMSKNFGLNSKDFPEALRTKFESFGVSK